MLATIITTYNNSPHIRQTIDSVYKQSVKPDLVLVVDDNSTDGTPNIVSPLTKKYDNLKFLQTEKNGGASVARNLGITSLPKEVDLFSFLDGDDFYYSDKLKKSLKLIESSDLIGMVYTEYDVYNEEKKTSHRNYNFRFDLDILKQTCIPNTNSLFRKSVFDHVGLFNEGYRGAEDYDMWLRIGSSYMICGIPESLFCYRDRSNGVCGIRREEVINNTRIIQNAYKYI